MTNVLRGLLTQYWIVLVALALLSLGSLADPPVAGAQAQETPRIDTVPDLALLPTPTNTPFPSPTPDNDADQESDEESDEDQDNQAPTALTQAGNGAADAGVTAPAAVLTGPGLISSTQQLTGVVAVTTLNLRRAPSLSANRIDTLFRNEIVALLGKSQDGAWWYVCCGAASGREGWVYAQALRTLWPPVELNRVLPIGPGQPGANPASAIGANRPAGATPQAGPATGAVLQAALRSEPPFVWQGATVQLHLTITNQGDQPLTQVRVRDELPATLRYLSAQVAGDGQLQQSRTASGAAVITIEWAQIPPGASLQSVLTVAVSENTPPGGLIDNLALVTAANAADTPVGITLAMPPTTAPQFRTQ